MTKTSMTLAAAIMAGLTMTSAPLTSAGAYDGVRLNFGGPLPTFVARPYPPVSGPYDSYRKHCYSYRAKKTRVWRVACR